MPGCLCVSACVHVTRLETGCCIDEAGLPIHYYRLGSTTPCHIPPLLTCATSNQPSQSPRSATGGKLYTCTLDTEKNCIQAPGHSRLLSILTHTSGPGPATLEGGGKGGGHGTRQLRARSQNRVWIRLHHVRVPSCGLGAENAALTSSKCVFYPEYTGSAVLGSDVNESSRSCTVHTHSPQSS